VSHFSLGFVAASVTDGGRDVATGSGSEASTPDGGGAPDNLVTFEFAGVVQQVTDPISSLSVAAGDAIVGMYRFDPSQTGTSAPGTASYAFDNGPGHFEFRVNAGKISMASGPVDPIFDPNRSARSIISIEDDAPAGTGGSREDSYEVDVVQGSATDLYGQSTSASLRLYSTKNLDAVTTSALPLDPPNVARFENAGLILMIGGGEIVAPYAAPVPSVRSQTKSSRLPSFSGGASCSPPRLFIRIAKRREEPSRRRLQRRVRREAAPEAGVV
jgi:hypothetical protein